MNKTLVHYCKIVVNSRLDVTDKAVVVCPLISYGEFLHGRLNVSPSFFCSFKTYCKLFVQTCTAMV